MQGNTGEYIGIQENTEENKRIQGNTREYRGIQENAGEYKRMQGSTREYRGVYMTIQWNITQCIEEIRTSKYIIIGDT